MLLGEIDPVLLPQGLLLQFMGWGQPQMAARQIQCVVARKATQQWHVDRVQHRAEQLPVAVGADAVEHHPCDLQSGVMVPESLHHGRQRCGLTTGIHHQHHRQAELVGHRRGAALLAAADAIEQAHHPLHESEIRAFRVTVEGPLHPAIATEVEVEIAGQTSLPLHSAAAGPGSRVQP